jgi:hypothetical protein
MDGMVEWVGGWVRDVLFRDVCFCRRRCSGCVPSFGPCVRPTPAGLRMHPTMHVYVHVCSRQAVFPTTPSHSPKRCSMQRTKSAAALAGVTSDHVFLRTDEELLRTLPANGA